MSFFKPIDKVSKFTKLVSAVDDETQKRILEEAVLLPDPLKQYSGPLPKNKCALDKRVVRIVFPSIKSMDVVNGILNITTSSKGVQYITDISLFIEFCRRMKEDSEFKQQFSGVTTNEETINIDTIEDIDDSVVLEDTDES